ADLRRFYQTDFCVPVLICILIGSPDEAVRQLAAVEAIKLIPKKWSDSFAKEIHLELLKSTVGEPNPKVRHASARLIAAIARQDLPAGKWPELPVFCQNATSSPNAQTRAIGLFVIHSLFEAD